MPPSRSSSIRWTSRKSQRVAFKTDRLGEFVGRRELTAQIGHPPDEWPLVLLKEALDNSLDGCEDVRAAPDIAIDVSTSSGTVTITARRRALSG